MLGLEWSDLLPGVIVPLIALAAGWVFHGVTTQANRASGQVYRVLGELRALEDVALTYWCKDFSNKDKVLEVKIKSAQTLIDEFEPFARDRLGPFYGDYDTLVIELMERVTGGDFETTKRLADFECAAHVRQIIYRLHFLIEMSQNTFYRTRKHLDNFVIYIGEIFGKKK